MGGKCLSAAVPFSIHSLQEMRESNQKKEKRKKKRKKQDVDWMQADGPTCW